MKPCVKRDEVVLAVIYWVAVAIVVAFAYYSINSSEFVSTSTEATMQWSSDTASWKGGW